MPRTSPKLRKLVRDTAENRCEYCQTLQEMTLATFHVDHILPQASGGSGEFENLCLSCPFCNEFKAGKSEPLIHKPGVKYNSMTHGTTVGLGIFAGVRMALNLLAAQRADGPPLLRCG